MEVAISTIRVAFGADSTSPKSWYDDYIMIPQTHPRRAYAQEALLQELWKRQLRTVVLPRDWPLLDEISGSRGNARVLLHRLARAGRLRPIRRGAYAVRNERGVVHVSTLELIGAITMQSHLVTAGRALQEYGLTDQGFREIVVATPAKERGWEWQGERVRYVRLPKRQLWGGRDRDGTTIASPERAILDSLAHPGWGVTLSQVVEAIGRAHQHDPRFVERLAAAAARYGNTMLARRLGYVTEETIGPDAAQSFLALRGRSNADAPLVAGLARKGARDSRWLVAENVPIEALTDYREVG